MSVDKKEIIQAMRNDPEQGLRQLMSIYMQSIYWHIRRMVGVHEDAEDATQETFLRVFRSFSQYDEGNSLQTWLFRIATNEALRILGRRSGKEMASLDDVSSEVLMLKEDEWFDSGDELAVKLQQAIHTLPAKQQTTFNLRYYDELSYADIAEITGSTVGAAKANYHVAKEKIIQYMNYND